MQRQEANHELMGNDKYEGYCIDLLKKIARLSKFNYTIHEVKDKAYGIREENGKWNGMVGELINGEADLAVASLTISYSRSEVIDFTVPYMHLGISILFKKPQTAEADWFMFLWPLSWEFSFLNIDRNCQKKLFFIAVLKIVGMWDKDIYKSCYRISPFEKVVHNNETGNWDKVDNQFSFRNAFWFTVCSLMQQVSRFFHVAAIWLWAELTTCTSCKNRAVGLSGQRVTFGLRNFVE
ncbi:hypothetical protein ANCCAN_24306 [Ancylostoma caninum]|uniref:Ionotropic glutamate receptor L-glutamate and glycine-binding domain-containing protein n=1 Tax=Ancylostoma caninum TaxID=29170 RepID=A0A368FIC8_ANCCA|nr:hypothetical protein ANCCAN_24306 [Ancylostoma caninum]